MSEMPLMHRPKDIRGTNGAYYVQRVARDNGSYRVELYHSADFTARAAVITGRGHTQIAATKAAILQIKQKRKELRKMLRTMRWLRIKLLLTWPFRRKHKR